MGFPLFVLVMRALFRVSRRVLWIYRPCANRIYVPAMGYEYVQSVLKKTSSILFPHRTRLREPRYVWYAQFEGNNWGATNEGIAGLSPPDAPFAVQQSEQDIELVMGWTCLPYPTGRMPGCQRYSGQPVSLPGRTGHACSPPASRFPHRKFPLRTS